MEHSDNQAIYRLNALLEAGYVLDSGRTSTCMSLSHPNGRFRYRHAYVYDSGQAVMPYSDEDEKRYFSDDDNSQFDQFIASVPKPTFWQRVTVDELSGWIWGSALGAILMHLYLR